MPENHFYSLKESWDYMWYYSPRSYTNYYLWLLDYIILDIRRNIYCHKKFSHSLTYYHYKIVNVIWSRLYCSSYTWWLDFFTMIIIFQFWLKYTCGIHTYVLFLTSYFICRKICTQMSWYTTFQHEWYFISSRCCLLVLLFVCCWCIL